MKRSAAELDQSRATQVTAALPAGDDPQRPGTPEHPPVWRRLWRLAVDHPVLMSVGLAVCARLAVAVVIAVTGSMTSLALDTQGYIALASDRAAGDTADWTAAEWAQFENFGTYVWPLTAMFWLLGTHEFLGQLLALAFAVVAVAATVAILRRFASDEWALAGGVALAFFPSTILWSSLALRDSAVWAVAALLALVTVRSRDADGRRLGAYGAAAVFLVFAMAHLRFPSLVVAAWALMISAVVMPAPRRFWRVAGTVLIAGIIPATTVAGPFGWDMIKDRDLGLQRARNAEGAETAVVDSFSEEASEVEQSSPDLNDDEVTDAVGSTSVRDDLWHLPRGASIVLLEPFPWSDIAGSKGTLAKAETVVWYPLLGLAVLGVWCERRRLSFLVFPLLVGGGMITVYALSEGNFGTAYRHRGEVVWVVALFAVFGASAAWGRLHARIPQAQPHTQAQP